MLHLEECFMARCMQGDIDRFAEVDAYLAQLSNLVRVVVTSEGQNVGERVVERIAQAADKSKVDLIGERCVAERV